MLNYNIKILSLGDLFKFKKLVNSYSLKGYLTQKNLKLKLNSILGLLFSIPLDSATLHVEQYNQNDIMAFNQALNKMKIVIPDDL